MPRGIHSKSRMCGPKDVMMLRYSCRVLTYDHPQDETEDKSVDTRSQAPVNNYEGCLTLTKVLWIGTVYILACRNMAFGNLSPVYVLHAS